MNKVYRRRARRRNPISTNGKILLGAGAGAAITALVMYVSKLSAAAAPLQNAQSTQIHVTLTPGAQYTSYLGGTMFADLPPGATGWVVVNGAPRIGFDPYQLPAPVVGTYTFTYILNGAPTTTTLTVTQG